MDTKNELIRIYEQWPNILDQINSLIIKLKRRYMMRVDDSTSPTIMTIYNRREINGSFSAAKHTTELLRNIVSHFIIIMKAILLNDDQ